LWSEAEQMCLKCGGLTYCPIGQKRGGKKLKQFCIVLTEAIFLNDVSILHEVSRSNLMFQEELDYQFKLSFLGDIFLNRVVYNG
jgi:hypothetical protein